jgi:hypothetical protein
MTRVISHNFLGCKRSMNRGKLPSIRRTIFRGGITIPFLFALKYSLVLYRISRKYMTNPKGNLYLRRKFQISEEDEVEGGGVVGGGVVGGGVVGGGVVGGGVVGGGVVGGGVVGGGVVGELM